VTGALYIEDQPRERGRCPLLIAHACNSERAVARALDAGADAIEADVWLESGRLTLRHERKLPHLPLLVDKWYVRRAKGLIELPDLAREVDGRAGLFLDLKSQGDAMLRAVARAIERLGRPFVQVSSRHWNLLDALLHALPGLSTWYSVGSRRELAALFERVETGRSRAEGVSVRHGLLDARVAARLREAGLKIYAWIVPDPERGERIASLGAHGVIADNVHLWTTDAFAQLSPLPVTVRTRP
jgi:glycerophosphoryl diester phosphodiesterase